MRRRVTVLGLCVCLSVCLSGTTSPATTRNRASNRRYLRLRRNLGNILNMAFSLKMLCSKVMAWKSQQANKYVLTATSYGADGATFRQIFRRQGLFWFFQSLTAGYKLPGIVRQRATSLSAVQHGFCFCSLPYTFRYMFVNACAFSEPHARATAL